MTVRILGLDPGLRATGYGVIDQSGGALHYVASGCVRTQTGLLVERIGIILRALQEVIGTHAPLQIALEKVFVNINPQSTLALGQARGAALCAAVIASLPVAEYTALQVKQSVVGNGHADKKQVQHMVCRLLALPKAPQADAADALAVAICHAHASRGLGALVSSNYRVRRGRLLRLPSA